MATIPASLRYDYYHSLPSPEDTDQILLQKLQQLYHYRHDLVHLLCEKMLGIVSDFSTIKKLAHYFGDILPDHLSKLSPDIVIEKDGVVTLIDISVSKNHEFNYQEKYNKYNPVLIYLNDKGFEVNEFYMFWVDPFWMELENSINNFMIICNKYSLTCYKPTDKLLDDLKLAHEAASEQIQLIRRQIPVEGLNKFDHIESPTPDLLSNLEFETAASKSYPAFPEIVSNLEASSLEEAENIFKELVEDLEVQDYIKDERHDHHMYARAFETLKDVESLLPVGDIKPSFFIPYATLKSENIHLLNTKSINRFTNNKNVTLKIEQSQVLHFLNFLDKSPEIKDTAWFPFINHIILDLEDSLCFDTELNIFNTGMLTGKLEDEMIMSKSFLEYRKKMIVQCLKELSLRIK
jgi:hypothetical protein